MSVHRPTLGELTQAIQGEEVRNEEQSHGEVHPDMINLNHRTTTYPKYLVDVSY